MKIEFVREFLVLSESLNFTQASKKLFITQPALSNHIASLEKDLGFDLLQRSRGNATRLTKAGAAFLPFANQMIGLYEEAIETCSVIDKDITGKITVQLPIEMHAGTRRMLDLINAFKAKHPHVEVTRKSNSSNGLISETKDYGIDFSMTRALYAPECAIECTDELSYLPLAHEELYAWVDKDHPLAQEDEINPSDLAQFTFPYMMPYHQASWRRVFDNLNQLYGIKVTTRPVFVDIREDFYLGNFDLNDCLLLSAGYTNDPTFSYRTDHVWKRIVGHPHVEHWIVAQANSDNYSAESFFSFVSEEQRPYLSSANRL